MKPLTSSVHAHSHSVIEESVILPQVDVGQYCKIKRAIIDRGCKIPVNLSIGYDKQQDIANGFRISAKGIVLVTPSMITALAEKKVLEDKTNKELELELVGLAKG